MSDLMRTANNATVGAKYRIIAFYRHQLVLVFERFELERGIANGTKGSVCLYDALTISEPSGGNGNETDFAEKRKICGNWTGLLDDLTFNSTGNRLRLTLTSDHSEEGSGFKIKVSQTARLFN